MRHGRISKQAKNNCRPESENRACNFNPSLTSPNASAFLPACLPVRVVPAQASVPLGVEVAVSAHSHVVAEALVQPHAEVLARLRVEAEPSAQTRVLPSEQPRALVEALARPHAQAEPLARHALSLAPP